MVLISLAARPTPSQLSSLWYASDPAAATPFLSASLVSWLTRSSTACAMRSVRSATATARSLASSSSLSAPAESHPLRHASSSSWLSPSRATPPPPATARAYSFAVAASSLPATSCACACMHPSGISPPAALAARALLYAAPNRSPVVPSSASFLSIPLSALLRSALGGVTSRLSDPPHAAQLLPASTSTPRWSTAPPGEGGGDAGAACGCE